MEPCSYDFMGAQPPTLIFLEIRAYKNHYSVIRGYFRLKKLSRNRYFTRYRVLKLRCLLHYTHFLIYVRGFNFKVSYKDACEERAP